LPQSDNGRQVIVRPKVKMMQMIKKHCRRDAGVFCVIDNNMAMVLIFKHKKRTFTDNEN